MAQAKYTIYVPKTGMRGELLPDIAQAAHHYLMNSGLKLTGVGLERDRAHIGWDTSHQGPHDVVWAHGEETPENDSHMKQVGSFVAELAGHPAVYVERQGKGGPVAWPVRNLTT